MHIYIKHKITQSSKYPRNSCKLLVITSKCHFHFHKQLVFDYQKYIQKSNSATKTITLYQCKVTLNLIYTYVTDIDL